jgi:hypothetical protein
MQTTRTLNDVCRGMCFTFQVTAGLIGSPCRNGFGPSGWLIGRASRNCRFPPSLIDFVCALVHFDDQVQDSENV